MLYWCLCLHFQGLSQHPYNNVLCAFILIYSGAVCVLMLWELMCLCLPCVFSGYGAGAGYANGGRGKAPKPGTVTSGHISAVAGSVQTFKAPKPGTVMSSLQSQGQFRLLKLTVRCVSGVCFLHAGAGVWSIGKVPISKLLQWTISGPHSRIYCTA